MLLREGLGNVQPRLFLRRYNFLTLSLKMLFLQRNQFQWELTYGLQYEIANRFNYNLSFVVKHERKKDYLKRSEGPPIPHT
jgi:hypothetical protein